MKQIKSAISFILMLTFLCAMFNFTTVSATSYENWKQYDSQWADFRLGSGSGTTMQKIGCRVTAIAIVCAKLGLVDSNFNPGTFAKDLKSMGAFTSSGAMYNWTDPEKIVSGLKMVKKISLTGSQADKAAVIAQYTTNGYACTISVRNAGHYVAADYVSGNTVYMHNPGSKKTDLFATYANSGITSIRVFKSTKSSSNVSLDNESNPGNVIKKTKPTIDLTQYPTTVEQGKSFGLRGTIYSENNVSSIKGCIINSSGSIVMSTFDEPYSTSNNVRYLNLNQNMLFNKLAAGTYTLKVEAKDSSGGGSAVWERTFTVKGNEPTPCSHSYNKSGYCDKCNKEYPISLTSMNATYEAVKNDVPVRNRPYSPDSIIKYLSKGTKVTVVASGKNSVGNLWYKLNDGTWIYSGNLTKSVAPAPQPQPSQTTTSIRFEIESMPKGNLPYGKSFSLKGWFRSDSAIVEARAYMLDANKNVVMQSDPASSTTSNYKIQGYKLDKAMKFDKLSPGGYYLKFFVRDANGDTFTWISDKFYIVK